MQLSKLNHTFNQIHQFCYCYRVTLLSFAIAFILAFTDTHFFTSASSSHNLEQWVNLTNEMFYGNQDFLFSYGPLYWLTGGCSSEYNHFAYILAKIFISTSCGLFWALCITLLSKAQSWISNMLFALAFLLFIQSITFPPSIFLLPVMLVYFLEFYPIQHVKAKYLLLIGLYVGFSFYIRFFFGIIGILAIIGYLISYGIKNTIFNRGIVNYTHTYYQRQLFYRPAIFIFGIILGYLLVGLLIFKHYESLLTYFTINTQLSFGNSVDMTQNATNTVICWLCVGVCFILLNIYLLRERLTLFLSSNLILLLLVKLGFSRLDHYVKYFVLSAPIIAVILILQHRTRYKAYFVLLLLSLICIASWPSKSSWVKQSLFAFNIDFKQSYAQRMANAYQEYRLNKSKDDMQLLSTIGGSTIDVYPYNNEYMFANGFNYSHRPIFQNYMTLTPALDKLNQQFFTSTNKPDFVLWTQSITCYNSCNNVFDDIDNKSILNEDPLTTSSILFNYHVSKIATTNNGSQVALFAKNAHPTPYHYITLSQQNMRFDTWYDAPHMPSDVFSDANDTSNPKNNMNINSTHNNATLINNTGVIKLLPRLTFTWLGKLKNLLLRGDIVYIDYKLSDGTIKRYRVNILNAQSGIWVSPYVQDFTLTGKQVISIKLTTNNHYYLKPSFSSQWVYIPLKNVYTHPTDKLD